MGVREKMVQRHIQNRIQANKLKTCSRCELDKPQDAFSGRSNECNTCKANRYVTCACGCKRKEKESKMQIYVVSQDKYWLNQGHHDRYWGIERDSEGYVICES